MQRRADGNFELEVNNPNTLGAVLRRHDYQKTRMELTEVLFDQVNKYHRKSDFDKDAIKGAARRLSPTALIHKGCRKWSDIAETAGIESQ